MPDWLASLSRVSPVYWALDALAGAMWREYSLADMVRPLGALVAFGLAGFVGGWLFMGRSAAE